MFSQVSIQYSDFNQHAKYLSERAPIFTKLICFYMPMKYDVPFQLKKSEVKQLYQLFITDFTLFGYSPAEFIDSASSD